VLVTDTWIDNRTRAFFVADSLGKIGINVRIVSVSPAGLEKYIYGLNRDANGVRNYDLIISEWSSDYQDPESNISHLLHSDEIKVGYNSASYENATVDALIVEQAATTDEAKRCEVQSQLMDIVLDDVPYVPLEYRGQYAALNAKYSLDFSREWLWYLPFNQLQLANN
jgi:ABC-type oligopeptide transport system substrate-binding subunit